MPSILELRTQNAEESTERRAAEHTRRESQGRLNKPRGRSRRYVRDASSVTNGGNRLIAVYFETGGTLRRSKRIPTELHYARNAM